MPTSPILSIHSEREKEPIATKCFSRAVMLSILPPPPLLDTMKGYPTKRLQRDLGAGEVKSDGTLFWLARASGIGKGSSLTVAESFWQQAATLLPQACSIGTATIVREISIAH